MQQKERRPTMPDNTNPEAWPLPDLHRARRAIVVVDVVESVRLMQEDEAGFIGCWRRFVNEIATQVLPKHGGRLVKSLGDGLMLEFETVPPAVAAALDIQARVPSYNAGRAAAAAMYLRIGAHVADVVVDELDVYGAGVNLAARLAGLADSGEVVVSAAVRDEIVDSVDAIILDLGDCYLKHVTEPVRAFRVAPASAAVGDQRVSAALPSDPLRPTIAVLSPIASQEDPIARQLAPALADDLSVALSRSGVWRVTSRLSTLTFAGRELTAGQLARSLRADYLIAGRLRTLGERFTWTVELVDAASGEAIWADGRSGAGLAAVLQGGEFTVNLADDLTRAALRRQIAMSHLAVLPNLPGYTLLLRSIVLMHKLRATEVEQSRKALEHLVDRHPRVAEARAWLAKWHFLQLVQPWDVDENSVVRQARDMLARALRDEPGHAMSLAIQGHLAAFIERDLSSAHRLLQEAAQSNPNEPLAWLFLSNVLAAHEQYVEAVQAVEQARALSPMDPMNYFFDTFAATAYNAAGRFEDAMVCAERSVRLNAHHLPGLVELIVAQMLSGRPDAARRNAERYLALRPQASVDRFVGNHVARDAKHVRQQGEALLAAGLPH
jgi:adenylate cyclase